MSDFEKLPSTKSNILNVMQLQNTNLSCSTDLFKVKKKLLIINTLLTNFANKARTACKCVCKQKHLNAKDIQCFTTLPVLNLEGRKGREKSVSLALCYLCMMQLQS